MRDYTIAAKFCNYQYSINAITGLSSATGNQVRHHHGHV